MAEAKWYAIQTYSGHENKVQRLIQRRIDEEQGEPETEKLLHWTPRRKHRPCQGAACSLRRMTRAARCWTRRADHDLRATPPPPSATRTWMPA